jgi:hypothetical protein
MKHSLAAVFCLALFCWAPPLPADEPLPETVELNRDIRPILSDNCFQCHGPDRARRKADLRLDTEAGVRAVVSGSPDRSELIRRITTADDKERMPPPRSRHQLTARQVQLLRRWVEQGAPWQPHWSLLPPRRPPLPAVKNARWPRNPIDSFVLARLEKEGLAPSPEADRITLLRRATLDLTGLPPTPAEVDAFVGDSRLDAYERVVDRLLASPRYGERMALPWLEAARYADTNGYQSDGERSMWRWRDWVIDAFNRNLPFDQFTIEQLAGDLLPSPTLEQKIATGFNRNHRGNGEGGIIPEEYAVEYVVDRVDTTATVWLGLTLGCARCHDHKFDPVTQKEFYRLFAYFNNVPERGKAIKYGNSPPVIKAPTAAQEEKLRHIDDRLSAARARFEKLLPRADAARASWEQSPGQPPARWSPPEGLIAHFAFDGDTRNNVDTSATRARDGSVCYAEGRIGKALDLDGERFVDAGDIARFGFYHRFSFAAWIYPCGSRGGTLLSRMVDGPREEGYSVVLEDDRLHVNLVKRWLDDAIRVQSVERLAPDRWHHVVVTYDGSRVAGGIRIYLDGQPAKIQVDLDDLNQSFLTKEPFRIGAGGGPAGRFHGRIDDLHVYHRCLEPEEAAILSLPESLAALAALPADKRSPAQTSKLRRYFLENEAPAEVREAYRSLGRLQKDRKELLDSVPTTMVMEEMPRPRDTHVLIRGEYDRPGAKVAPGMPASLPPLQPEVPNNRLGLARWLVSPANPLTARVVVNRYWQTYFGLGLVRTTEDFGSQGEWPSHPELLDWLATEFVRTGWNIKAMQRLIVTSATYRQASRVSPRLREKDPENRLLARAGRLRLPATALRDQALFASGLLVERLGGPSVRPYQPDSLWLELADTKYVQEHGENLYRRSLYTFWKRTVAPPNMITFDAAGRETCVVRTARTNTPLQALILMNEMTFVEAARVLAQRVLHEAGPTPRERLTLAFRLVVSRPPRPAELQVLLDGLEHHRRHFQDDPDAARRLIRVGEAAAEKNHDLRELAAYAAVTSLILNLDEAITRE